MIPLDASGLRGHAAGLDAGATSCARFEIMGAEHGCVNFGSAARIEPSHRLFAIEFGRTGKQRPRKRGGADGLCAAEL